MRILLLAMPDSAHNFHRIIRVPNLGLCSIAAHLEGHEVRIADLVLAQRSARPWLRSFLREFRPHLIGISSMSFQYDTAIKIAAFCRSIVPETRTVLGGYHATLAGNDTEADIPFDFLIRGEGEQSMALLVEALEEKRDYADVAGMSWKRHHQWMHNPCGPLRDLDSLKLPLRSARILGGFSYFDSPMDCVETSRGCTMPCTFCSITGMYGSSYRCYPVERVMNDLRRLQRSGTRTVLLVDDNISLDPRRFMELAEAIIASGLDAMEYIVQASVAGIVAEPDLIPLLARANFTLVFLGIESVQLKNLNLLRKGDIRAQTETAVRRLRGHGIAVMGGFIVGNPDDAADDVREVFREARRLAIDLPVVQCVTPYPGTGIRHELLTSGLVTNLDDLSRYTGFMCNVRTHHLTTGQLNRLMNWENIRTFFSPALFRNNYFTRNKRKGAANMLLNSLDYLRGWFTGNQFRSRHTF